MMTTEAVFDRIWSEVDWRDLNPLEPGFNLALRHRFAIALLDAQDAQASFQERVQPWMMECFGPMIAGDREERNHRFLEEALELVQACGCSASEAHQLVDYVYGRPIGEKPQEVGGVMVTLAALCLAHDIDLHQAAEIELARIWTKVEAIRAKQAAKPKHSPLPEAEVVPREAQQPVVKIKGADEYGPLLEWGTHWAELIGKSLYLAAPTPERAQECLIDKYSSRVCERGSLSCDVEHTRAPESRDARLTEIVYAMLNRAQGWRNRRLTIVTGGTVADELAKFAKDILAANKEPQ